MFCNDLMTKPQRKWINPAFVSVGWVESLESRLLPSYTIAQLSNVPKSLPQKLSHPMAKILLLVHSFLSNLDHCLPCPVVSVTHYVTHLEGNGLN